MSKSIPINSKYFFTLHQISEGNDQPVNEELVRYLVEEEYVLSQGKFGWALTNKGREFIRQYSNDRDYLDVIRADWPTDLLAVLRRCEFNARPEILQKKLREVVTAGYLIEDESGQFLLTDSAKRLLLKYHE